VANAFNNFLITNEKLNIQQINKGDAISIPKDLFSGKFLVIKLSQSLKLR
jgi:hypothetical protein